MKKMTGDSYLLIGIMLFTLAFGLVSLTYPQMKTKLVPATVSAIAFVLAGIQLLKELSKKEKEKPVKESKTDEEDDIVEAPSGWRENLVVFAWLSGFLLAIYLVGFIIGTLLLVWSYMKFKGFGWMKSSITAGLATGTIYVVFIVVLKADLFTGIIIEAFSG
jgi:hypothetical protein